MATCFIRAVVRRWCLNPKGLGSNPSGSKIAFSHLISAAGPKKRITGPRPHRPAGSGMWAWSPSVRLTGVRSSGPGHGFDGPGHRDRSRATCMLGSSGPGYVRLLGLRQVGSAVWPFGPGSSGPVAWWLRAPVASGLHRLLFV
ncbi:hypothetical protein M0R45_036032 [Rubus argutus]|uniref:Uncharacterized protein n=1 Tax=Rubus argutus TaxID=59490 RepID=A0AAW1VUU7_RUBAR